MENRASYLLVGLFVLASVAAAFVFVAWLAQSQADREFRFYDVYFTGSVAGLAVGGDVRYRGIRIGEVHSIAIDPQDPGRVQVTARIGAATPIREGDQAALELQGITGVSFVNIGGADAGSTLLVAQPGQRRAVIPSTPSAMEQLVTGAPDMLASAVVLMGRLSEVLNDDNQAAFGAILADVRDLTASVAGRRVQIERTLDSLERLSGEMLVLVESARKLAATFEVLAGEAGASLRNLRSATASADELLRNDVRLLVAEMREGVRGMGRFASTANAVLEENRESLNQFTGDGFKQLSEFLNEASLLVSSMARLTERLDSEGARFLIGAEQSEIRVQNR